MKPTQKQIEREALRLFKVGGIFRTDSGMWKLKGVRSIWFHIALHILRRIAAAERRGYSKGMSDARKPSTICGQTYERYHDNKSLAEMFGVRKETVRQIKRGILWKHIDAGRKGE